MLRRSLAWMTVLLALAGCRPRGGAHGGVPAEVRVLVPSVPVEWDPLKDGRLAPTSLFNNVFETLVRDDPDGVFAPVLADSWVTVGPEQYEFRLRPGRTFHDGSPVTPADVARSLERSRAAGSSNRNGLPDVEAIEVLPDGVRIRMKGTSRNLLEALSGARIVKKTARGLVGSGPYELVDYEPGRRAVLALSERFRGGRPLLSRAEFVAFETPAEALRLLGDGKPAIVFDPPAEVLARAEGDPGLRVVSAASVSVTYLAFNLATGPPVFRDVRFRRGVAAALDRTRLAAEGRPRGAVPASQVVSAGVFGFDPQLKVPARDLAAARRELAAAGLPEAPLTLEVGTMNRRVGELVVEELAEAGLPVKLEVFSSDAFRGRIESGNAFYVWGWVVGLESGSALHAFFHTKDVARGWGLRNRVSYSNPVVDEVLERALQSTDPSARLPELQRVCRVLAEDLPWIPLFSPRNERVLPRGLNLRVRPDGILLLSDLVPAAR